LVNGETGKVKTQQPGKPTNCRDISFLVAPDIISRLFLLTTGGGLGPRLRMALMESFKFSLVANSEMTVRLFLVSLYKLSPAEVGFFFSDTAPIEKLLQELSSIDVSVHEITPAKAPGGPTTGMSNTLNVKLTDLLIRAAEVQHGAEISDFMR